MAIDLNSRYGTKHDFLSYSFAEAEMSIGGTRQFDYYLLLWTWGNMRESNINNARHKQDTYYNKHGWNKLLDRMNRVRKWFGLDKLHYKYKEE